MDFISIFIRGIIQNLSTRYGKIIAFVTVLVVSGLNSAGRPVYRNVTRNITLQRRDGQAFTTQSR